MVYRYSSRWYEYRYRPIITHLLLLLQILSTTWINGSGSEAWMIPTNTGSLYSTSPITATAAAVVVDGGYGKCRNQRRPRLSRDVYTFLHSTSRRSDSHNVLNRNETEECYETVVSSSSSSSSSWPSMTTSKRRQRPIRKSSPTHSTNANQQQLLQQQQEQNRERARERYVEALKDPTLFNYDTNGTSSTTDTPSPLTGTGSSSSTTGSSSSTTITGSTISHTNHFDTIQPKISSNTLRAIQEILLLQQMTQIQYHTYPVAMTGSSILGRARTGTGKTMAYLLPAIERLLRMDHTVFRPGRTIGIVIIAPTRELVIQLADEATKLLTYHSNRGYTVQPLFGGISIQRDRAILLHRPIPTVLISTPGRLYDVLRDSSKFRVHGNRLLVDVLQECPIVILDEADQLIERFTTEINTISSFLPRIEKRQTMLFSATISSKLKQVLLQHNSNHGQLAKILPTDYATVDCVNDKDVTTQTNQRVTQSYIQLLDMKLYVPTFLSIVQILMDGNNSIINDSSSPASTKVTKKSRVIIFLPTAKLVKFFTEVLHHIRSSSSTQLYEVYSIHSRMSQGSRNRASTQFRTITNTNCILLSSDVSARGVDYPDVTFVVQYGAPYNDELYLHRLGRTGRAGQEGNGLLVVLPFETRFRSKCRKYHIVETTEQFNHINQPNDVMIAQLNAVQNSVRGGQVVLTSSAEAAYISFVAHYIEYGRDNKRGGSTIVLNAAKELADSFGLPSLPSLPENVETKIKSKRLS